MKKLIFAALFVSCFVAIAETSFAQSCDKVRMSPIRCGYYEEGYQDGANDAKRNQSNDYKRYRSKFEKQYETYYQSGYDDGFASVRPFTRWSDVQKNTYDQGFDDGRDDKNRNISRLPARYEGQYDRNYVDYYSKGYYDGYDGREKRYDTPMGGNNRFPTRRTDLPRRNRGTSSGVVNWFGRVDNRVNVVIKGGKVTTQAVAGPVTNTRATVQGALPRRAATMTVQKLDGRGTVFVIQQPARSNDFTGIVQIYDPRRGRDNYQLRIAWTSRNTVEAYSSGKVSWRGRVDSRTIIRITGEDVESIDEWKTGLTNVSFEVAGYLAARPGTVRVNKREGRGDVSILEQPSARNDYTAVILVFDEDGGADDYEVDIEW